MPHFKRITGDWAPRIEVEVFNKSERGVVEASQLQKNRRPSDKVYPAVLPFLSGCVPCVYLALLSLHYFDVASSAGECMNTA